MQKKSRFATYNDGILFVCTSNKKEADFGATKNATTEDDLNKIIKLAYAEMSKRDEDQDFAESQGRVLSMKVKTRMRQQVNKLHMVMIGSILYSIIYVDFDKAAEEMYLYLEEARKL
jgi:hypothetical protein